MLCVPAIGMTKGPSKSELYEMTESTRNGNAAVAGPRLKTAVVKRGHTQPLIYGTVKPRGFEVDFEDVPVTTKTVRRMVRYLEFDFWQLAMTTYLCARASRTPF